MEFNFNSLNLIKPPKIAICRQDLQKIGYLNATNVVIKPTFCSLTELTFTCYEGSNHYDCLKKLMVLEVDGYGRFQLNEPEEKNDGVSRYLELSAYSYEASLNKTTLTYKEDTVFKLWDAIQPEKTLLGIISSQTGWKVSHVDGSLLNRYRTMSIDNAEVYGLLAGDISDAFKCYFVFDTMNMSMACYDRERAVPNSGINLSFRNLINEMNIKQSSDDVTTALTVEGAEGVGINVVNPLGNNVIYDFSYYCNDKDWGIPKYVQDAIKKWTDKIESNRRPYADLVLQRRELSDNLVTLDGELNVLKSELKGYQDVQAVDIAAGNNDGLKKVFDDIQKVETKIKNKENEITNKKAEYDACLNKINTIVDSLSFKNNFTDLEYNILKYYINSSVYENENFVYTSTMTEAEKIEMSQQLYDQGLIVMDKLSKPLYEFTCDVSPFFFTREYEQFAKALELGTLVNLEIEDGVWVTPRLMQVVIDYDNPDNATVVLSDSYRLSDDIFIFSDDFNQTIKASRKTSLTAPVWDEPNRTGFFDTINEYINNALNLANQEIINATNQEFTIGSYGLRGKMYDPDTDTYDNHQLAMTNNVLAFTDDNWQSCRAALGRLNINGTEYYGVVGETVIGNLIAGNQLTIMSGESGTSSEKSLVVDANGTRLKNADFTIENNTNRILISPSAGFKIQTKQSDGSWKDVLSEDTNGYIVAKGIKLEEADIGGWTVTKDGLSSPTGDFINSNGTGKLSLMTWNNNQANFDGNIYANNLFWRYGDTDYASLFSALDDGVMFDGSDLPNGQILKYGGEIFYGVTDKNVRIYSRLADVSEEAHDLQTLFVHSNGNVIIDTDRGGLVVRCETGVTTTKLSVSQTSTFVGDADFSGDVKVRNLETGIDGAVRADSTTINNIYSRNAYKRIGVQDTMDFRSKVRTTVNPGTPDEISYECTTREYKLDDYGITLKFVNGLLVN